MDRQTESNRQKDRQTDRQTDSHTDIDRDREIQRQRGANRQTDRPMQSGYQLGPASCSHGHARSRRLAARHGPPLAQSMAAGLQPPLARSSSSFVPGSAFASATVVGSGRWQRSTRRALAAGAGGGRARRPWKTHFIHAHFLRLAMSLRCMFSLFRFSRLRFDKL
jgi:hypothetical protein